MWGAAHYAYRVYDRFPINMYRRYNALESLVYVARWIVARNRDEIEIVQPEMGEGFVCTCMHDANLHEAGNESN